MPQETTPHQFALSLSKRFYLPFSLLGLAALVLVHWLHSWPALSRGHVFPDLGDSPQASALLEVLQIAALLFLFGLYLFCLLDWERLRFSLRGVAWLIAAQGVMAWLALPANSTDIFGYIGLGRIAAIHGANPYVQTYSEFADSYAAYVEWDITMPYGPALLPVFIFVAWLSEQSVLVAVYAAKLVWLLVHFCNCRVLYLILKGWGKAPAFGLFLFGLNPLVLLEQPANGHNDGAMMLAGLLAMLALQRHRHGAALVLALLSALVKLPGLFFLLVVLVYLARGGEWRALARGGAVGAGLLLALKATLFPSLASMLSLTNVGEYTKNSLHFFLIAAGKWLSAWLGAPMDYDELFALDRRIVSVLFFLFCLWRLREIWASPDLPDLNALVRELALLFLVLLTLHAAWFFPWYVAWLIPLAALTEWARLRWAIVAFSASALAFYAFPHSWLEPPSEHWFLFSLRIAVAHLTPLAVLAFASTGNHTSRSLFCGSGANCRVCAVSATGLLIQRRKLGSLRHSLSRFMT